jgi:hypothetical protein
MRGARRNCPARVRRGGSSIARNIGVAQSPAGRAAQLSRSPPGSSQEVSMKKLLGIVLLVAAALGYTACGNSYKSPTAPANMPGTGPTPTPGGPY